MEELLMINRQQTSWQRLPCMFYLGPTEWVLPTLVIINNVVLVNRQQTSWQRLPCMFYLGPTEWVLPTLVIINNVVLDTGTH
jgi:hypothetical protein